MGMSQLQVGMWENKTTLQRAGGCTYIVQCTFSNVKRKGGPWLLLLSFKSAPPPHLMDESTKYVYIKSSTGYVPSSELGPSQPLSRQRVCPSPQNRGGGGHMHSPAVVGLGESQFDDWRKSLALCLLCGQGGGGDWTREGSKSTVFFQQSK